MNTICKISDIDIYILYFLKIKTIFVLSTITKEENELISKQDFIREMKQLRQEYKMKKYFIKKYFIIDLASQYRYVSILQKKYMELRDIELEYVSKKRRMMQEWDLRRGEVDDKFVKIT